MANDPREVDAVHHENALVEHEYRDPHVTVARAALEGKLDDAYWHRVDVEDVRRVVELRGDYDRAHLQLVHIAGGEFAKAADNDMVYWVEGAPTKPTVKHMLDPYGCQPCANINACSSAVIVSDAFLAALPTSSANFSCSMLPSVSAPLQLTHADTVVIKF